MPDLLTVGFLAITCLNAVTYDRAPCNITRRSVRTAPMDAPRQRRTVPFVEGDWRHRKSLQRRLEKLVLLVSERDLQNGPRRTGEGRRVRLSGQAIHRRGVLEYSQRPPEDLDGARGGRKVTGS